MDLSFFNSNISNPATLIPAILKEYRPRYQYEAYKNYEPETHAISLRPPKMVSVPYADGRLDPVTGQPATYMQAQEMNKISLAIQKRIVNTQVSFITGGNTSLTADTQNEVQEAMLRAVNDVWSSNKLRFKNGPLAKAVLSQLEACEIWYSERRTDGTVAMKSRFYFPAEGYQLIPVFDNLGDMVAFGLQYESVSDRKRYMDLYTAESRMHYVQTGAGWAEREPSLPLNYGKIPVIYYSVAKSAWHDVQTLIDREERLLSVLADVIDYNGSPTTLVEGTIISMAGKGEAGKMLELQDGAKVSYLSLDSEPQAIITEHEILTRFIHSISQTPDISLEAMQGLGELSGAAFDRIMIDPHLKARDAQEGWYGEGIQRRLNFLVAACAQTIPSVAAARDLSIQPVFSLFKIEDERERIENMKLANGGLPVIDHRSSIEQAGLVRDADAAFTTIQAQEPQETISNERQV